MRFLKVLILLPVLLLALIAPGAAAGAAPGGPAVVTRVQYTSVYFYFCDDVSLQVIQMNFRSQLVSKPTATGVSQHITTQGSGTDEQGNEYVYKDVRTYVSEGFDFILATKNWLISKGPAPDQLGVGYYNSKTGQLVNETTCR